MFSDLDKEEAKTPLQPEMMEKSALFARQLEHEMHKLFPETKAYQNKAWSLLYNLKDPKNPQLR